MRKLMNWSFISIFALLVCATAASAATNVENKLIGNWRIQQFPGSTLVLHFNADHSFAIEIVDDKSKGSGLGTWQLNDNAITTNITSISASQPTSEEANRIKAIFGLLQYATIDHIDEHKLNFTIHYGNSSPTHYDSYTASFTANKVN